MEQFGQLLAVVIDNALVRFHASEARSAGSHFQVAQFDEFSAEAGKAKNTLHGPIRVAVRHRASTDSQDLNSH